MSRPWRRDASELPSTCDAVDAQDAILAGVLAERYPDTRLVAFATRTLRPLGPFDHQRRHVPGSRLVAA